MSSPQRPTQHHEEPELAPAEDINVDILQNIYTQEDWQLFFKQQWTRESGANDVIIITPMTDSGAGPEGTKSESERKHESSAPPEKPKLPHVFLAQQVEIVDDNSTAHVVDEKIISPPALEYPAEKEPTRTEIYDAFMTAKDKNFSEAVKLASEYVRRFKDDARAAGPEYMTYLRMKDWLEYQKQNAFVPINIAEFQDGKTAITREDVAQKVASALGFTDTEMEAYAQQIAQARGEKYDGDRFKPFYSSENLEEGLKKVLAEATVNGAVNIGDAEPGSIAAAREWLAKNRASISSLGSITAEEANRVGAEKTLPLLQNTTAELIALDAYNLPANFTASAGVAIADIAQGAGLPLHLIQSHTAIDDFADALRKEAKGLPLMNAYSDEDLNSATRAIAMFYAQSTGGAAPAALATEVAAAAKVSETAIVVINEALGAAANAGSIYDAAKTIEATEYAYKELQVNKITDAQLKERIEQIKRGEKVDPIAYESMERHSQLAASIAAGGGALLGRVNARAQMGTDTAGRTVTTAFGAGIASEMLNKEALEISTGKKQDIDLLRAGLGSALAAGTLRSIAEARGNVNEGERPPSIVTAASDVPPSPGLADPMAREANSSFLKGIGSRGPSIQESMDAVEAYRAGRVADAGRMLQAAGASRKDIDAFFRSVSEYEANFKKTDPKGFAARETALADARKAKAEQVTAPRKEDVDLSDGDRRQLRHVEGTVTGTGLVEVSGNSKVTLEVPEGKTLTVIVGDGKPAICDISQQPRKNQACAGAWRYVRLKVRRYSRRTQGWKWQSQTGCSSCIQTRGRSLHRRTAEIHQRPRRAASKAAKV
ncbi:MAG TPA: hypothetical protein V6D17_21915 [Candidatus Obscuribacterales bacterium]